MSLLVRWSHSQDHLGNVRVTFSTVEQVETFMATMEATEANDEQGEFLRYEESAKVTAQIFDHTHRDGTRAMRAKGKAVANPEVATRLSGIGEERYGLAKSIRVMPGDKVRMEVFAKYIDPKKSDWQGNFSDVVTALRQARPAPALDGALQKAGGASSIPLTAMLAKAPGGKAPKAYLNYVMYDDNFQPIMDPAQTNYVQVTENAKESGRNGDHERLYAEVEVQQAGYLYIYLSNDNYELQGEQVDVFFDDFQIQQVHSKVVQSDDYYPFGLTFNSYSRENGVPNMFQYNGKEMQDELDLGWMDYGARTYMPEIGRWGAVDPLAGLSKRWTPYNYCYDNPVNFIDPDGMYAIQDLDGNWHELTEADYTEVYRANPDQNNPEEDPDQDSPEKIKQIGDVFAKAYTFIVEMRATRQVTNSLEASGWPQSGAITLDVSVGLPAKRSLMPYRGDYKLEINGRVITVEVIYNVTNEEKYNRITGGEFESTKSGYGGGMVGKGGYYFWFMGPGSDGVDRAVGAFRFKNEKDFKVFKDDYRERFDAAQREYYQELQQHSPEPKLRTWATQMLNYLNQQKILRE